MSLFDTTLKREGTCCVKWDQRKSTFGTDDVLPMSIADMDFLSPTCVGEALCERAKYVEFGYNNHKELVDAALIRWMKERHQYEVEAEEIYDLPGVVIGIVLSLLAFTKEGDKVLIQSPVYPPFFTAIQKAGRKVVENLLLCEDGKYFMDMEDLEKKLADPEVKMMILCSPHNPVGRVWTKEELTKVGELCMQHDVLLVVDEIHADIVFSGHEHTVFNTISEELANRTILLTSAGKFFNISGLNLGFAIIHNPVLRKQFFEKMDMMHLGRANIMGAVATEAAYTHGAAYLDELLSYLEENRNRLVEAIAAIPKLSMVSPEGTYLGWIDFSELVQTEDELKKFLVKDAKLGLNFGSPYGEVGTLFARINFAVSKECLEEAIRRLEKAVMERLG